MAYKFQLGSGSFGGSMRIGPIESTGSVVATTSFVIGSADLNETDLEKLDGITDGTAAANKAVVLDGSKNIGTIGTVACGAITTTGLLSSSAGAQFVGNSIFGGTLNVTGNADFNGTITCDTSFTLDAVTVNATELGFIDGVTAGTAAGSKALVLASNRDIATVRKITADGVLSSSAGAQIVGNSIFGGTLNVTGAATLASTLTCGAITTTALVSSSAGANFIGAMTLGATLNVTGAIVGKSTISASSNMHANQLQIANTESSGSTISGSNAIMFIDSADGFLKGISFQNYASQIAGANLTATNGKLAASAGGGDSLTAATLAVSGTAAAGINFMTVTISSSVGVKLPASPSVNDLVYVKVKDGLDPAASPPSVVSIVRQGSHTIDGLTSIDLESPYASVGLVYVASNDWRII